MIAQHPLEILILVLIQPNFNDTFVSQAGRLNMQFQ